MVEEEVDPEGTPSITLQEFIDLVSARFDMADERMEAQEQHMAELTMAYMEINATVEALLNSFFGAKDTPEAIAYQETVTKIKAAMLNWMEHAGENMATGGDSLNEAVLRLVRERLTDNGPTPSDPDPGDGEAGTPSE